MHQSLKVFSICIFLLSIFMSVTAGEIVQNYYGLGVFAYEEGNYKSALDFLLKAVNIDEQNARANFYLGQTYARLEQPDQAEHYLTLAFSIDPGIPGLKYSLGLLFFEKEDYGQALAKFEEVTSEDPADVLAVYYSGISQYKLEQYAVAEKNLLKAADLSPTIEGNGYYYAGVCSYQLERFDQAVKQFEHAIDRTASDDLKKNAQVWVQTIKKQQAANKPYSLYLKTGYVYDDNVVLEPADLDIVADESDSAFLLYFNGKYDVIKKPSLTSGIGYSHYMTRYQDLEEYDLTGSMGNFYFDYSLSKSHMLGVKYLPTYYWADAESFLMQHQVTPFFRWLADDYNVAEFSYHFYRNNYFKDSARDGHASKMTADFSHVFTSIDGYLFCGVGYEIYSADAADEDFYELGTILGISCDIFEKTNLTAYANFYDKNYDHMNHTIGVKRDDARYFASVSLSQNVWKQWLHLAAEYTYTRNNSNITEYDYERNAILFWVSVKL